MKFLFLLAAMLGLAACMGSGGVDTTAESKVSQSLAVIDNSPDRTFSGMLNGVRSVYGSAPVTYDMRLGVAARRHADDMLANDFFDHKGSDGSTVETRVRDADYNWTAVGENIAKGYADEEAVLKGWVNSPDHQRNNVNPSFEDFALARAGTGSNSYWVLVLAAEQ